MNYHHPLEPKIFEYFYQHEEATLYEIFSGLLNDPEWGRDVTAAMVGDILDYLILKRIAHCNIAGVYTMSSLQYHWKKYLWYN